MTKTKTPKLPAKPSELIRLALKDLEAVERDKKTYVVDMGRYHEPNSSDSGKCAVCFAGAVMSQAGNDPHEDLDPVDFSNSVQAKLVALDYFRVGSIYQALREMQIDHPRFLVIDADIAAYSEDPWQFKRDMAKIADALQRFGL